MIRKAALLHLLFFFSINLISGCCNCGSIPDYHFRWKDLKLTSYSYTISDKRLQLTLDSSADFSKKNYAIELQLSYELLSAVPAGFFGFANMAYACKCAVTYTTENAITRIRILTENAFDNTHPAESDVTEYFGSPYYAGSDLVEIRSMDYQDLLSRSYDPLPYYGMTSRFLMIKKPSQGSLHRFKILISYENSTTDTLITQLLKF
jgi:hypothetical protein